MRQHKRDYYQLTHPQQRIWYTDKINTSSHLHNIGGLVKMKGHIDINRMEKTLNIIVKKNDGLRLRFTEKHGEPIQYVEEFHYETIDFLDFSKFEIPKEQHEKWVKSLFETQFILEESKLHYFAIYKISENEYGVVIKFHHGICDGWGITLVQNQICEIYSSLINNNEICADDCNSYLDFIKEEQEYLNSDKFIKNKNFWNEKLKDIPEEFLYNSSNSLDGKRVSFYINNDLSKKIQKFVKDKKCSLNTFFIAILLIYINKSIQENDLVIGTPVFNRGSKAQKSMVGMFTSTMPFRFKIDTELNIDNVIKQINRELKYCFINQKYPYDLLVKDLEINKEGYDSLFKMSVNYYNSKFANDINSKIKIESEEYHSGNQSHSLQLVVQELEDENIKLNFDYKTLEYTDNQIITMYKCMMNIISNILKHEHLKINEIEIVSEEEKKQILYDFNDTNADYPRDKTIQELFEEQVERTPHNIAVVFEESKLTYRELNEKSNQLARVLIEQGVGPNTIVGIMVERSLEMVVGIMGILKAGGAYLPIDPEYPVERIRYMLEDSKTKVFLTKNALLKSVEFDGEIVDLEDEKINLREGYNLHRINAPHDLAYIIYTSGTTGNPKGVMIEHKNVVRLMFNNKMQFDFRETDVWTMFHSYCFDFSVWEMYGGLLYGGKLILVPKDKVIDTDEFLRVLKEEKVTVLNQIPTPFYSLMNKELAISEKELNLRYVIFGGEALKPEMLRAWIKKYPKTKLINMYGITETTVHVTYKEIGEEEINGVISNIGKAIPTLSTYIMGMNQKLLPIGMTGELYVGGEGVARGYLNREELTNQKFVANPYKSEERLYQTGDLARWLPDGNMEYLGRIDHQVKVRGFRIELGEIENQLLKNVEIKEAVVVDREDKLGNKYICAYVVSEKEVKELNLRAYLIENLPEYMIPSYFVKLEKIPLTNNGKLNRRELPEPNLVKVLNEYESPNNEIEEALVKVWVEVLGVDKIGINDNFYELGGDSIKAIQISSKLKNLGLEIRVKDILTFESIDKIATTAQIMESNKIIEDSVIEGTIINTPIIEWFINEKFIKEDSYNQYIQLEFKSSMDINMIRRSIKEIVCHHDSLRINYDKVAKKLFYNNASINEENIVECINLSEFNCDEQISKMNEIKYRLKNSFDLENSTLFKLVVFNLSEGKQSLLFMAHHLIVDGISWRIIVEDFLTIMNQLSSNEEVNLPMKTHSFKAWANALQDYSKKELGEEKAYWQSIADQDFEYPKDFDEGKDTVETANILNIELDEVTLKDLTKKVNEIYNLELNETLAIALVITLNDLSNSNEIVIELERHGREAINDYIDISRTVGWFTSMYPAYFTVNQEDMNNTIKSLKEQLRNIPNKGFNYSIMKFLNNELNNKGNKHIRLNYLGEFDTILDWERYNVSDIKFGLDSNECNLLTSLIDIDAMVVNKKLSINFTYSRNRFEDTTIQKFIDRYIYSLRLILDQCDNKDLKEFTPSDFDAVGISQEDLDSIFN